MAGKKKKGAVTGIRQERDMSVYFCGLDISFVCAETGLCNDLIFASPCQGRRATLPARCVLGDGVCGMERHDLAASARLV